MSNISVEVRKMVENYSTVGQPFSKRIDESLSRIFDFEYPLWNESYKKTLERKIIMHYINKEICMETVALWKIYLEERLNLIMPYYNELYKTVDINFEWLIDVDKTETSKTTSQNNNESKENSKNTVTSTDRGTNNITNTDTKRGLSSDTPQANYNGLDYADKLTEDTSNSESVNSSENNVNSNGVNDSTRNDVSTTSATYEKKDTGLSGSRTKTQLNLEYRESIINIDKMIIEELNDLFILVYDMNYGGAYCGI